jgi:hypothetical protein
MRGYADASVLSERSGRGGGDRVNDFPWSILDLAVGKPQYEKVLVGEPSVSFGVMACAILMRRTIRLDDQTVTKTDEIGDVATDHDLSPKLQTFQPPVPKQPPKGRS